MLPRLLLVFALATTGCPSDDDDTSADDDTTPAPWKQVFEDLPAALISVWGTSADDVWTVGADAGDGPLVLHWDGTAWTRVATGASGDLWWVHGFAGGPVYMGGEGGLLLRVDPPSTVTVEPTPGTATVFGIWGASATDLWAVGGEPSGSAGRVLWRSDGSAWTAPALPVEVLETAAFFKVWGSGAGDVWIVGTSGSALHWDGTALAPVAPGTSRTLLTVHAVAGGAPPAAAVGGFGTGVIVEHDGTTWTDVSPPSLPQLNGVWLTGTEGWAVGVEGAVVHRGAGGWEPEPTGLESDKGLHAVWVDPEGNVWAVGGNIVVPPLSDGILIRKGPEIPGTYE